MPRISFIEIDIDTQMHITNFEEKVLGKVGECIFESLKIAL